MNLNYTSPERTTLDMTLQRQHLTKATELTNHDQSTYQRCVSMSSGRLAQWKQMVKKQMTLLPSEPLNWVLMNALSCLSTKTSYRFPVGTTTLTKGKRHG